MDMINRFLQVCVAITNAFAPPLFVENGFNDQIADVVVNGPIRENEMDLDVLNNKIEQRAPNWNKITEHSLKDFPKMTMRELKLITLGPYQLNMGRLYNEAHYNNDGYIFHHHKETAGLIRIKMQSRYSKRNNHLVWIKYRPKGNGRHSIIGWYCKCRVGARTLGCCSHVAAVTLVQNRVKLYTKIVIFSGFKIFSTRSI